MALSMYFSPLPPSLAAKIAAWCGGAGYARLVVLLLPRITLHVCVTLKNPPLDWTFDASVALVLSAQFDPGRLVEPMFLPIVFTSHNFMSRNLRDQTFQLACDTGQSRLRPTTATVEKSLLPRSQSWWRTCLQPLKHATTISIQLQLPS